MGGSSIRDIDKKKGDATIMALVAIFLGILIFFVMVGFVFKIPGLGGKYLGFVLNTLSSALSTIWDLLGKIIAPFIKEMQEAAIWAALTIGISIPIMLAIRGAASILAKAGIQVGLRDLLKLEFWKKFPSFVKMGIKKTLSGWWGGIKTAFSQGIWKGIKYVGKSLIKNGWKIAAGFAIGMAVEIGVSYSLDWVSYKLVGKGFSQAIDDAIGGPWQVGGAKLSLGGATQSAISGAISGAVVGSIIPGVGTAIGAAVGAVVGFFTGLFFG